MQSEAIFLIKYGKSNTAFEKRDMIVPDIKAEEVCIEVESFGLNYADVMARNKMYREAPPLPAVLGYDVVGKVVNIGKNADENLLGKRVLAFTRFGGYAKHVNTSFKSVVEVGNMEANKALALGTRYVTAYYMSEYLTTIHENENALIHAGAGGVGLALIQILKAKKVIIFAKVSSDEKCDFVLNHGANFAINYKKSDYIQQLSTLLGNQKLIVSFNPVGGSTFKKDFQFLGAGGKLFLFGGSELTGTKWGIFSSLNFVRKMGLILPIALMMKSKSILGVNMLKVADETPEILSHCMNKVIEMFENKTISPILGESFSVDDISKAHAKLESGLSIGKISVDW